MPKVTSSPKQHVELPALSMQETPSHLGLHDLQPKLTEADLPPKFGVRLMKPARLLEQYFAPPARELCYWIAFPRNAAALQLGNDALHYK